MTARPSLRPVLEPMSDTPRSSSWSRRVTDALGRHMWLKAIGTPLFIAVFFGAYFYVLRHPVFPTTTMPETWLDGLVGFAPWTMALYVSLWVYVSLPPALLSTRRALARYALAIGLTCIAGLAVFWFWPTAVPVPDIDWTRHPEMIFLKQLDSNGNAFPSLHVATAIFSGIWLHHLLRSFDAPRWTLAINWAWCLGIVYSTLATRQHVALDVWAGLALGGAAAWVSLRAHRRDRVPAGAQISVTSSQHL